MSIARSPAARSNPSPGSAVRWGVVRSRPRRASGVQPGRQRRRRVGRARVAVLLVLLAGWAGLSIATAAPALAHATVIATDPVDGARLEAPPDRVTVTFSESVSVEAGFLRVVDGEGKQVSQGDPTPDGPRVSVPLPAGLGDGSYIASYRIVSPDSHPIGGAFSFVVGDGPLVSATGSVVGGTTDPVVEWIFTAARFGSFAGIVVFGGLAFVVLCWPAGRSSPRVRRVIWSGWTVAATGAVLALLLEGPYAAGTGLADALDPDLVGTTLGTTYGRMLSARLVLLGVIAVLAVRLLREQGEVAERVRSRDEDLAAICGLGVLATYGGVGHAAAGSQPTLALLSDTAHLAAATLWIGGLIVLLTGLLPTRRTAELAQALPRFSRLAMGSVAVLALTGTYQAWREIAPLAALWSTEYGRLVLLKILGFVLLVGLGNLGRIAVRRHYVTPVAYALSEKDVLGTARAEPPAEEEDRLLRRLRASVGIEVAVAAAVLAVAAILVSTPPARATYSKPVDATVQLASGGSAALSLAPARVGANTVTITVRDPQGAPVDAREVSLTAALPAEQIGPLPVQVTRTGTGTYGSTTVSLPRPGRWELVLRVQKSEFDRDVAQVDVPVS